MNLGLSVLSAILLVLVFPRFNLTWLAPLALTPILIACARESSWKRRFLHGWAAGIVFWFWVCNWIQGVLQFHGGLGLWLSWVTFVLFAVLKGLHMALFATLAGFVIRKPWAVPAVAALWTGIERTHGPFGFAWLDLGNAGIDMPIALRVAPFVGVYGLSFVFAMLGCAVALIILRRPRMQLVWVVPLLALPLLPALPLPAQGTENLRVVQPDVDTEAEFTPESLGELEQQMAILSHAPGVPLIVWPEWPAPFDLTPSYRAFVAGVARDSHASLIFNGLATTERGEPLNSAFLVNPEGAIVDRYDQITLVPFGEYVPPPFGWVNRITKETSDFVPGNRIVIFPVADHRAGVFICYESAFPDLVRQSARDGAELLINLSNDGYFAHSAAREQHLALVRMRAAENHRWILRSTNDGITAMIDPAGRITEQLQPYRQLAADMHFQYSQATTYYTRHGDWFSWGCLAAGLIAVLTALI
ncbi:MAG TPA: apolipoprotein N-acyltransferase [Bryobacteraceae bacterium]